MNKIDYDKEFQKSLKEYITLVRKEKKCTMDEVSDYIGISKSLYSRYEKGTRNIPLSVLKELCNYYAIDYYKSFQEIDRNIYFKNNVNIYLKRIDLENISNQTEIQNLSSRIEKLEEIIKKKGDRK